MKKLPLKNNLRRVLPVLFLVLMTTAASFGPISVFADQEHSDVAGSGETVSTRPVGRYGMTPISGSDVNDGTYDIDVDVSSQFFRIDSCKLTIKDGKMTAAIQLDTFSYSLIYNGTGKEAAKADVSDYIEIIEDKEGYASFTIPVDALDKQISIASFSTRKNKWYDRTILFDATSLPASSLRVTLPDFDAIEDGLKAIGYDTDKLDAASDLAKAKRDTSEIAGSSSGDVSGASGSSSESASGTSGSSSEGASGTAGSSSESTSTDKEPSSDVSADTGESLSSVSASSAGSPPDAPAESGNAVSVDRKDGEYSIEVNMTGGSGRASVTSPTLLIIRNGKAYAKLYWSSTYYDYMIVDGVKYQNNTRDGGTSTFIIPITSMDAPVPVIADTTAMGDPVEISYQLTFYADTIGSRNLVPQIATRRVLIVALFIILAGAVLSFLTRKTRYR
ncbi:hypothetical protein [Bilifractor sp. HCP3S3_D3]|uniref:hypothetical protein n=1 Tax=Bilifractor sp. HCP3S3_D3 TaxID=3438907 RepID=UPI003F8BB689